MALVLVALLVVGNVVRYGYPSTTPLFGWNPSTRTTSFVERLEGDDRVRDFLVEARNRSLIKGESHTGVIYIWSVRSQMPEVTGRSGRDLDQYMLRLNLKLIASNPASYVAAVTAAAGSYVLLAAPPAADFGVRPLKLLWMAIHFGLALVFASQACVVAGLAVLRRLSARVLCRSCSATRCSRTTWRALVTFTHKNRWLARDADPMWLVRYSPSAEVQGLAIKGTKNRQRRVATFAASVIEPLDAWSSRVEAKRGPEGFLFPDADGGFANRRWFQRVWARRNDRSGRGSVPA